MVTAKDSPDNDGTDESDVALADYMRRVDAGEVVDRDEFIARYPRAADDLREYFESADELARMAGPIIASTLNHARSTGDTQVSAIGDSVPEGATEKQGVVPLPQSFGRYRVEKQLGAGAMGAVYLAHDTKLDRPVALKTPAFDAAADADLIERFYREAKSAANLRHAGICPVFDVGEIDGVHFISMAYIDGKPLSEIIDLQRLSTAAAASLVCKTASALEHAHRAGVIHRDLKPANIMIDGHGDPLIMDFGLARRVDTEEQTRITLDGMIIGTPAYMSPEQVEAKPEMIGPPCDIYSLGVILFELLTGRRPFQGSVAAVIGQIMTQDAPPPSGFCDNIDPDLDAICVKMIAREAADRFADMREVETALSDYLNTTADGGSDIMEAVTVGRQLDTAPSSENATSPTVLTTGRPPSSGRGKFIGWLGAFGFTVVLGAIILVRTLYGTLQIEVLDPDITVLIDEEKIQLTDDKWSGMKRANRHRLAVRIGTQTLKLGAKTPCTINGEERLVHLNVEGVTLEDDEFEIVRNDTTVVRISIDVDADLKTETASVSKHSRLEAIADPDRRGAEWVRSINSHHFTYIVIRQDGAERKIGHEELKSADVLPTEPFELTGVFLQYNRDLTDKGLVNLRGCKHLTVLNFTYTGIGDAGLVHLKACARTLKELHLPGGVTDVGLANFAECRELTRLTLHGVKASYAGLASFQNCRKLTSLSLGGVKLTGESLESFAECPLLKNLNLRNTGLDGAELANFEASTKLDTLDLSGNPAVTSKELGYFQGCKDLSSLVLARTNVDDKGMALLIDFKRLTYLDVDQTKVTDEYLESFRVQKPNCKVVSKTKQPAAATTANQPFILDTDSLQNFADVQAGANLYSDLHFELTRKLKTEPSEKRSQVLYQIKKLQWPADRFKRERIPKEALTAAGWGDASKAPREIVALLGDSRLNCWSVIYDLTLTDNEKVAVVSHQDGSVSFHDLQTGQLLRILDCHDEIITAVEVSPDGNLLATGCVDGSAALWDSASGTKVATYTNQADWISEIRFSPDGSLYAMSSRAGDVCVYESQNPKPLLQAIQHDGRRVEDVAFIDNKHLATASDDTTLRIFEARSGVLSRKVTGHTGKLRAVEFSRDSSVLATLDTAGKLLLHDTSNWQPIRTLPTTANSIPYFSMSRNGKAIVVREAKETLGLWEVESGKQIKKWDTPPELATIYAICVDPNGEFVVSGNRMGRIRIRDFDAKEDRFSNPDRLLNPKAALSNDGTQLVLQDSSLHLQAWDLNSLTVRRVRATRTGMVCTDVSSDGRMLVTAGTTWRPRLFDIKTGKLISNTKQSHTNIVHAVAFSHDDSMIASGASDERLWLWDRKTMNGTEVDCSEFTRIRSLAFSPDDRLIAVGDKNGALQIRDASDGTLVQSFDGQVGETLAVSFTPNGKSVVQGTGDGVINIWDLSTKKLAFELKDHGQLILSLKFSHDGRTMASSSYDGSIVLWDSRTWKPKHRITLYPYGFGHVYLAGFTPEGRHLIAIARNGMAYVLRLNRNVVRNRTPANETTQVYPVSGGTTALAVSPDERQVAVINGAVPWRIFTRDIHSGELISEVPLPGQAGSWVRHFSYTDDGKSLLTCVGSHWSIVNATTGEESMTMEFPADPQIAVFPRRPLALALYQERQVHRTKRNEVPQRIRIWNWKTGEIVYDELYPFKPSPNDFPSISIDEKYFSYAQEHNHIRCPLVINGDEVTIGAPVDMEQTSRVRGPLVYSADGRYVATNVKNSEHMAAVLDTDSGRIVCLIDPESAAASNEGHKFGCNLAFTADSKTLVTADHAGRVAVWNLPSGERIRSLQKFHKSGNHDPPEIAVTTDGYVIVAGGSADPRMTIQRLEWH